MARFRGRNVPQSRGARLSKIWCRSSFGPSTPTVTQAELTSCTLTELALPGDVTLLRTRGDIFVQAAPNAAGDDEVLALGICVVNETARVVGGASLPGPHAD